MSNPNSGTPPFAIGGVDLSTLPQTVVERVDVVTGGASAAWGSDAVAGVVNLVINKTFSGVKGNFTFGDSYKDDHRQAKADLMVGTDILGGRGHIELAGSYVWSPDEVQSIDRDWYWGSSQIVPSASLGLTGAPTYVHVNDAIARSGSAQFTNGGLITANPSARSLALPMSCVASSSLVPTPRRCRSTLAHSTAALALTAPLRPIPIRPSISWLCPSQFHAIQLRQLPAHRQNHRLDPA